MTKTKTKTTKTTKTKTKTLTPGRPKGAGGGKSPALSLTQVKALLHEVSQQPNPTRNLALVHLLLSGLRVSEPLSLRVSDVTDIFGKVVDTFVLASISTKSGKPRRCYMSQSAQSAIAAWLLDMSSASPSDRLFKLNASYAATLVAQLMKKAGLKGSSHSLRRTAATTLCENGISPRIIQELLGHSSLAQTQLYLETSTAKVQTAVFNNLNW